MDSYIKKSDLIDNLKLRIDNLKNGNKQLKKIKDTYDGYEKGKLINDIKIETYKILIDMIK